MKGKPFTKVTTLDGFDYRVILMFAEYNMRSTETSQCLDVHRNTIEYRLNKIKRITGLEPRKFYDLVKLVEMARMTEKCPCCGAEVKGQESCPNCNVYLRED